jgi:uncharacterized membrane protein
MVLSLVSLFLRVSQGPAEALLPWGLVLSLVTVGILAYTGWLGGELVYHHRIGMMDAEDEAGTGRLR